MKEYKFLHNTFIGGWYIDTDICDNLITYFKKNKSQHQSGTSSNQIIDKNFKDSTDLSVDVNSNETVILEYRKELQKVLKKYLEIYPDINELPRFTILEPINIQYYKKNQGFKSWHCENSGKEVSTRILVFMTYLNSVCDGGTEFMYQKLITPAKKGLTLIWPANFTHVHRGQISQNFEKYIITGWYNYE